MEIYKDENRNGDSEMDRDENNHSGLINLLWSDILFPQILPYLSLKDLFVLRGLSSCYKVLIDSYFKQMKDLNLAAYSSIISTEAFLVLSNKCAHLKTLKVANCTWLTDDLIIPLFEHNIHLTKIVLNRCYGLTSVCLQPVIINCQNLETLLLAGCKWLTVGCLESITLHQRNLVEVDFSECLMIDNVKAINNFISVSHKLKVLNLASLSCVNDTTMGIISRFAKRLESLNIHFCDKVTFNGLRMVAEYCRNLKTVICFGCPLVVPYLDLFLDQIRPGVCIYDDSHCCYSNLLLQRPLIRRPRLNV